MIAPETSFPPIVPLRPPSGEAAFTGRFYLGPTRHGHEDADHLIDPDERLWIALARQEPGDIRQINECWRPDSTASARDLTPSLRYTLRTCDLRVFSETYSAAAIS